MNERTTLEERGDAIKEVEQMEAGRRALPGIPLVARIDGRAFHTFTRHLDRPFDEGLVGCMHATTSALVDEFKPLVGYTQSDEITLVFGDSAVLFGGRFQKYTSILASFAAAAFAENRVTHLTGKQLPRMLPHFDCRVWPVQSLEAALAVLSWREADAVKNSVQMLAQAHFSHGALQGKRRRELMDMLMTKGVNWNDLPAAMKRGAYFRRVAERRQLSEAEREAIPEGHRPEPGATFIRSMVVRLDVAPINRIEDRMATIFGLTPPVGEAT